MFLCWSLVLSMGSALRSPVVLCVLLSSQRAGNCWSPLIRVVSYSNLNTQVTLVYSISISQTPQKVCRFLKRDVPLSDPTAWEAAASTPDTQRSCSTCCTSQTSVIWRAVSRHPKLFHRERARGFTVFSLSARLQLSGRGPLLLLDRCSCRRRCPWGPLGSGAVFCFHQFPTSTLLGDSQAECCEQRTALC